MAEYKNFCLYVDCISYPNTGRYFETEHQLNGKHHMYALIKGNSNKKISEFFSNEQLNECRYQSCDEIISCLKDVMLGAFNAANAENNGKHRVVMLYVNNDEIYVAGFGEGTVYAFSDDMQAVKKISFERGVADAVCIGKLGQYSKYLLSVSSLTESIPTLHLAGFFSDNAENALDVYEEVCGINSEEHLVTASVSFKIKSPLFRLKAAIICVIALLVAICIALFTAMSGKWENHENVIRSDCEEMSSDVKIVTDEPQHIIPSDLAGIEDKLGMIAFEISGENSRVSYYIKNLTTGETLSNNPVQMYASNLADLYVVAEIYRQLQSGELSYDPLMDNMIDSAVRFNDFESSNKLISLAGGSDFMTGCEKISQMASDIGCVNTVIRQKIGNPDDLCTANSNLTTAEDCALVLERIYNGALVSVEHSGNLYELLETYGNNTKISKYIPTDTALCISKSGEAINVQNSAAIICTDKYDYIFCVMVNDFSNSSGEAEEVIARMSKALYDFLMQPVAESDSTR